MKKYKVPSRHVTPLYLGIVQTLDQRRRELGWTCDMLDGKAGLQRGYWAHVLHPHTRNGRVARWETLQWVCDALYRDSDVTFAVMPSDLVAASCRASAFLGEIARANGLADTAIPPNGRSQVPAHLLA